MGLFFTCMKCLSLVLKIKNKFIVEPYSWKSVTMTTLFVLYVSIYIGHGTRGQTCQDDPLILAVIGPLDF